MLPALPAKGIITPLTEHAGKGNQEKGMKAPAAPAEIPKAQVFGVTIQAQGPPGNQRPAKAIPGIPTQGKQTTNPATADQKTGETGRQAKSE